MMELNVIMAHYVNEIMICSAINKELHPKSAFEPILSQFSTVRKLRICSFQYHMDWTVGWTMVDSLGFVSPERHTFLCSISPRLALGLTQLPIQDTEVCCAGLHGHAVTGHSPEGSGEAGSAWICNCTLSYVFTALCLSSRGFVSNLNFPLSS